MNIENTIMKWKELLNQQKYDLEIFQIEKDKSISENGWYDKGIDIQIYNSKLIITYFEYFIKDLEKVNQLLKEK